MYTTVIINMLSYKKKKSERIKVTGVGLQRLLLLISCISVSFELIQLAFCNDLLIKEKYFLKTTKVSLTQKIFTLDDIKLPQWFPR